MESQKVNEEKDKTINDQNKKIVEFEAMFKKTIKDSNERIKKLQEKNDQLQE